MIQTIKNDDLEEIRVLGSGTYGAVYHGKWKGSDVAIKRIKASCFAGRPSERERLVCFSFQISLLSVVGDFFFTFSYIICDARWWKKQLYWLLVATVIHLGLTFLYFK